MKNKLFNLFFFRKALIFCYLVSALFFQFCTSTKIELVPSEIMYQHLLDDRNNFLAYYKGFSKPEDEPINNFSVLEWHKKDTLLYGKIPSKLDFLRLQTNNYDNELKWLYIRNLSNGGIRRYPIMDYLNYELSKYNIRDTNQFFHLNADSCSYWWVSGNRHYTGDRLQTIDGSFQGYTMSNAHHIRLCKTAKIKNNQPFKVFSQKNAPHIAAFNDLLSQTIDLPLQNILEVIIQTQTVEYGCGMVETGKKSVDTNTVKIYLDKNPKIKSDFSRQCWNYRPEFCAKCWKPSLDSQIIRASLFNWDKQNQHLAPDSALAKYDQKFVQLTPAQVRTMRLPALCPPRDLLTAIADYIDQTQPTFIFFKKYFQACEPTYNYFLLYYFDFPEGKAPILRDIRVVVPDNFGLNLYPN